MSTWTKLMTLFRASATEPAAHLVSRNSLRILEQELREAEVSATAAKQQLACLMAERRRLERDNAQLRDAIRARETQTREALSKSMDELAEELATLIAADENRLQQQEQQLNTLTQRESTLGRQLKQAASALQRHHQALRLARANAHTTQVSGASVPSAQGLQARLRDIEHSLSTIHAQQQDGCDYGQAYADIEAEHDGSDLNARLTKAGIATGEVDARQVLERLSEKPFST